MAKLDIFNKDIYNINKNRYIIDIINSFKMVFSKYQKQIFIN